VNITLVHGRSYSLYKNGCRCDACRRYQADRNRRNRADRLGHLEVHGIRSSYDAGCRCDPCKGARRDAYRQLASEYPQQVAAEIQRGRDARVPEMTGAS
jgi:hypothetical protein